MRAGHPAPPTGCGWSSTRPNAWCATPGAVVRVLTNLLDNARKYSPEGTPITVAVSSDDRRVVIDVRDAGDGIAEDDREAIFERFRRAEGCTRRRNAVHVLVAGGRPRWGRGPRGSLPDHLRGRRCDRIERDVKHITVPSGG